MKKILVFLLLVGVLASCKEEGSKHQSIETEAIKFTKNGELTFFDKDGEPLKTIDIETAISEYEQQTGLMYRHDMEENQGMLFIYDDERPRPYFYMKNTYIGLDLIYISADKKIVDINRDAKPLDETTLHSEAPAKYVLEISAGMADKWDLEIGDKLSFDLD
ncbi:MAG TPA: DUF192 domain-containing protein [Flavobacteriaceae bacterium]|nr:DUF192 domain-containing protein [Flavobacteriaceae bacterium]